VIVTSLGGLIMRCPHTKKKNDGTSDSHKRENGG